MHPSTANENDRLLFWSHVREFAVPTPMIESATARRETGDWAGACAAARVDVDLDLRALGRARGSPFAARIRADLRHLAPDLLRWHFPRTAPNGLLRPGITVSLASYRPDSGDPVHLVARTPPAWAEGGQRISLALWERTRAGVGAHPHPHPDRRFRLDLHRHLWDARRTGELAERSGGERRWPAEAELLLRAENCAERVVAVRLGPRSRLVLNLDAPGEAPENRSRQLPVLPDAATWVPPDLELLRAGMIDADRLHPLVAAALVPGHRPSGVPRESVASQRLVDCRGSTHRIGVVDGVLTPLDHDADEIRREELLSAFGGPPLPCLRVIDETHRRPEGLVDIRVRLEHGDTAGALAVVESLLGPDAVLRNGSLRDELETAARRQVTHGLYRAGLSGLGPAPRNRVSRVRARKRHASSR
ncbi:hypothetical protein [Allokutzneria sp. NRRL B-24872]|uniref:hypothetical protein n=1 Tax=Allokutzneria sp. NRRL B-24872 TaxID=1137961 RepID=UPI000A365660|nr:hypothetical protein [Allokutzneria sp. NRRL B-24872]